MKRSKNSPFLKEPAISDGKSSMKRQHRLHQANSMGKEWGHIEELLAMLVRECKGEKYLSSSIDDSSIDEIDDIIIDDPSSTDASGIIGSVDRMYASHFACIR